MNGRSANGGRSAHTSKGKGKLNKDEGQHSVPGFMSGGGHPKEWPARTGYTSESRLGPSSHGTKINLPKG
jgi:hypothetical protein